MGTRANTRTAAAPGRRGGCGGGRAGRRFGAGRALRCCAGGGADRR